MTDTDYVAVRTFADVWRDSNVRNGTDLHLNLGVVDGDVVSLNEPQLRAVLDELERLRTRQVGDNHVFISGWYAHAEACQALGWDAREAAWRKYREEMAATLAKIDSTPQQPERDPARETSRYSPVIGHDGIHGLQSRQQQPERGGEAL